MGLGDLPRRSKMDGRSSRRGREAGGFTFVEILVVVIIIGVLAAMIVPQFFGQTGKAKVAAARQQVATLSMAIGIFEQQYGRFPETLEELTVKPEDVPDELWMPPTVKPKHLIDPWGTPFEYRQPGEHGIFDLMSFGADKQEGGEGLDADIID